MAKMPYADEIQRSTNKTTTHYSTYDPKPNVVPYQDYGVVWVNPVPGGEWSSGGFMYKDLRDTWHKGIDYHAPEGSAILSPVQGTVIAVESGGPGGNVVKVRDAAGYVYRFAHMQYESHLQVGQVVSAGTQVGMVGRTGNAAGTQPHLHLEVRDGANNVVDFRPMLSAAVSQEGFMATGDYQFGPVAIPAGGRLYSMGGSEYVVFDIKGSEDVSHGVYFRLENGATYGESAQAVTAGQWANMISGMTNGGSTETFRGGDPTVSWDELVEQALFFANIWGTDAMSDEGVLGVIALFLTRPTMTEDELVARLNKTEWGMSHTDKQKTWNDKSRAQQDLEIVDEAATLVGLWFTYTGENLSLAEFDGNGDGVVSIDELRQGNPELANWASRLASGELTQAMVINQWIKGEAEKNPDSPWSQTVRNVEIQAGAFDMSVKEAAGQVMETYRQYGLDMSWDEALRIGHDIAMNDVSLAELTQQVDEQASAMYPNKPKGMTTMTWSQPYRQTMSSLWEEGDVGLDDATLQRALSEGMTLGDFRKVLKQDDKWLRTKNARDQFHGTLSGLGNQMGF